MSTLPLERDPAVCGPWRLAVALAQLLVAGLAALAITWLGLPLAGLLLHQARLDGLYPIVMLVAVRASVATLAILPAVVLGALWLRTWSAAPLPRDARRLWRRALAAWLPLCLLVLLEMLGSLLLLPLLDLPPTLDPEDPAVLASVGINSELLQLVLVGGAVQVLLIVLFLPLVLRRLCSLPPGTLRYRSAGQVVAVLLLTVAAAGLYFLQCWLLLDAKLAVIADPSWRLAPLLLADELGFALLAALLLLAGWRLLGSGGAARCR